MKIDDNYFTTGVGRFVKGGLKLPRDNKGVASKIIDKAVLDKVYGTSDEFIARYEGFQKNYLRVLETELDPRAAGRANLEILRSQGKIDLTILNKTAKERLRQTYINDILRLPQLMKEAGLPNINLPSANLYRQLFRYQVDTSSGNPAAMLLNSVLLNVNPDKVGLEAFNVGMGNIAGLRTVKQGSQKDLASLLDGKKVYTFDVETAGIFEGAQTRSMAIAEMTASGKISVLPDFNLSYASKQMGGLNVATANGASRSMSEFLQGNTRAISHGVDGSGFLDESSKFINKLMEADRVAGHNIYFDINALFSTMQQMAGYDKHEGAQKAVQMFTERMAKDEDFVVDTLQYTRAYLNDKVNAKLAGRTVGSDAQELSRFRDLLYSDDFMAKIHFGGSTGTSSVEAIAANTNLLQLLEEDLINGEAGARELFEKIYGGTHIADTDSFLQSYVAKYQMSKKLDVVESADRAQYSDLVKGAQRKILGSAAVTPTTNIASVSNLSEQVFQSTLTESGMKGVKLRTDMGGQSGLLQFDTEEGKYRFAVGQTISDVNQLEAQDIIRTNLMDARSGAVQTPGFLAQYGANAPAITVNKSDLNIIDLGINYTQAHQIDEITNLQKTLGAVAKSADETSLMARLGKTYKLFGSDPETTSDALRIARGGSPVGGYFSVGLEDYTARAPGALDEFATTAQKAADPYAFLDVRSRVFSTIMAEASAPYIERAKAAALANGTMEAMKYADHGDIMAEFGVSHFKGVREFDVFGGLATDSTLKQNIFMPLSVIEKAAESAAGAGATNLFKTGEVSLSYATRTNADNVMNAMFHLAGGTKKTEARSLVSSLFDLAKEASGANAEKLGFEADILEQLATFNNDMNGVRTASNLTKDDLIDQFTERLMSGRVGIANLEGEAADQAYFGLKRAGTDAANDVFINQMRSPIIDTIGDVLRTAPSVDRNVAQGAGIEDALRTAKGQIINFMNDSADILSQGNNATKARNQIRRAKLGQNPNKMLEFYINNKTKMGVAGLALGAVGLGYMASKKYREHSLYDETIEQQPTRMPTGQMMNQSNPVSSTINSYRRDPLVTAGVVGNLDRNKINHHKMGNDKNNHLFGG